MTINEYQERTWSFGRCDDYPDGPWKTEPDKVQWVDPTTGLDCLILRNHSGALCGYVGVPKAHPWHTKGYSESLCDCPEDAYCYEHSPEGRTTVHGGLTFADKCAEGRGDDAICHVPYEGREDGMWWFGFDAAHAGDLCPAYDLERRFSLPGTYRDVAYVRAECASLASQLQAIA